MDDCEEYTEQGKEKDRKRGKFTVAWNESESIVWTRSCAASKT